MEKFFLSKNLKKALQKDKKQLEKQLDIKIKVNGKNVFISAKKDGFSEYITSKIFKAIDMGFSLDSALSLANQNYMFELINIKKGVKQSRLKETIGRIIGTKGRAIKNLSKLTECHIVLRDNLIGIIGEAAAVTLAVHAVNSLIRGSPHSHVYKFLEKNKGKIYESENLEELQNKNK